MGAAVPVVDGVSRELAVYRTAHISDVCYDLSFTVPDDKSKPVYFEELLMFDWSGEEDLQIDFQGEASQLYNELMVNGKTVKSAYEFLDELGKFKPGDEVTLTLFRSVGNRTDAYTFDVKVVLVEDTIDASEIPDNYRVIELPKEDIIP